MGDRVSVPPTWIRFRDYQQEVSIKYDRISLNDVVESTPSSQQRIQLRAVDVYQIIRPYVTPRFLEQFKAVAPLALYLVVFQLLLLRQPVVGGWAVAAALRLNRK